METGNFIHITGLVIGMVPALAAMSFIQRNGDEQWRISNFLSACILLVLAMLMVGIFIDLIAEIEILRTNDSITEGVFTQLKNSGALWLVMFPLIVGGVGVNVLSAYLQSHNPKTALKVASDQ